MKILTAIFFIFTHMITMKSAGFKNIRGSAAIEEKTHPVYYFNITFFADISHPERL